MRILIRGLEGPLISKSPQSEQGLQRWNLTSRTASEDSKSWGRDPDRSQAIPESVAAHECGYIKKLGGCYGIIIRVLS